MTSVFELFESAARHQRSGRLQEAQNLYLQVVRADSGHALAWHQLGCIALYTGNYEAAFEHFRQAIRLDGRRADFHHNMGACCRMLGRLADAQVSYLQALRINPDDLTTRVHLCLTLYAGDDRQAADRCAEDALRRERITAEEHAICAFLLLLRGEFVEGWVEHEWRLEVPPQERRAPSETRWDGGPLAGRTILVYAEQGIGDTLQCLRYLPLIKQQGGHPILALPKTLMRLVSEANLCPVTPLDEPWPAFDVHAAIFSLPRCLRTTLDSVPANVPYLQANESLVADWRRKLSRWEGLRVGIHWQGSPAYKFDRTRSIPLTAFEPLTRVSQVRLFSLQKGLGSEQLGGLAGRFEVVDLASELDAANGPFMDTAAVIKNLDLVVACDSATAHLAGALGAKVWLPLSTMNDFRWMLDRADSPWYPTMRLFRQSQIGDWSGVFERMATQLERIRPRTS
jgi:tetratricopeptide (TPR) repeat protein